MTSIQILLLNLLYDTLCIVLPWDNVDEEEMLSPRDWSGKTLRQFMLSFGPISSLFVLFPMSDAVWRGYLSAAYRSFPATSVCSSVSDGMVFGIYVDTGFDFTFSANLQDSFFPEQGICTSNFYYSSGDYCFYFPYLCWWCVVVRTDEITPLVFRIFIAGGISLYAVEFSSKIFL